MIKEDYVSFETAKLLKEKGFEGYSIITTYDENAANAYIKEFEEKHLPYSSDDPKLKEFYYPMPTQQIVMKWLREVHNLFIVIDRHYFVVDKISHIASGFKYSIEIKTINIVYIHTNYESFEEACEAAIKYCLENLI